MAHTVLSPLAFPKNARHSCELCGQPATLECIECKVTYWCSAEHESMDRQGIHWRICEFVGPLRRPHSGLGFHIEREQRQQQQQQRREHLMRMALVEAEKLFNQGKYTLAVPAAMQALKFGQDAFGLNNVELAQPYILMGIACIGIGDLKQAEAYFSQANWIIVKNPDCSADLRSQLFRALGRLYRAKGNAAMALRLLADDVYHTSLSSGPESVRAVGGYFLMAGVFEANNVVDAAKASYAKVAKIWLQQLKSALSKGNVGEGLDGAQEAEADQQLTFIASCPLCAGITAATAATALGLLRVHTDPDVARDWFNAAKKDASPSLLQDIAQAEAVL